MDLIHPISAYIAENRSQQLVNVIITFGILETFFLALFIWARAFARTLNGVDFWLIPAAYLGCFSNVINGAGPSASIQICFVRALSSSYAVLVKYGGSGRHFITVTPDESKILLKVLFSEYFIYLFSVTLPKLAILCLYLRVFTQRRLRYAVYAIAIIMILNWLAGCFMGILMCKPIRYNWDKTIPGHCGDLMGAYPWASFPNLITDIMMLILPLPLVWKLHIGLSQKIGLSLTLVSSSMYDVNSLFCFILFLITNPYLTVA